MEFLVNLVRVPATLTAEERAELERNCRHVDGRYWIFEGDMGALKTPMSFIAEGVVGGCHEDDVPPGRPIIDLAVDAFRLPSWPPSRMIASR